MAAMPFNRFEKAKGSAAPGKKPGFPPKGAAAAKTPKTSKAPQTSKTAGKPPMKKRDC